ncbi:MAG: LiaF transmembrane domain-containing protein [Halanaerobium sp.]
MTDNRDRILIAVILIFAGIIFLGDTLGKYNFNIIFFLRSYWPLLFIIFGFHILLQKSRFWFLVPLVVIGISLYLIYMLVNQQPFYFMPQFRMRIFDFKNLPFR